MRGRRHLRDGDDASLAQREGQRHMGRRGAGVAGRDDAKNRMAWQLDGSINAGFGGRQPMIGARDRVATP